MANAEFVVARMHKRRKMEFRSFRTQHTSTPPPQHLSRSQLSAKLGKPYAVEIFVGSPRGHATMLQLGSVESPRRHWVLTRINLSSERTRPMAVREESAGQASRSSDRYTAKELSNQDLEMSKPAAPFVNFIQCNFAQFARGVTQLWSSRGESYCRAGFCSQCDDFRDE